MCMIHEFAFTHALATGEMCSTTGLNFMLVISPIMKKSIIGHMLFDLNEIDQSAVGDKFYVHIVIHLVYAYYRHPQQSSCGDRFDINMLATDIHLTIVQLRISKVTYRGSIFWSLLEAMASVKSTRLVTCPSMRKASGISMIFDFK